MTGHRPQGYPSRAGDIATVSKVVFRGKSEPPREQLQIGDEWDNGKTTQVWNGEEWTR